VSARVLPRPKKGNRANECVGLDLFRREARYLSEATETCGTAGQSLPTP